MKARIVWLILCCIWGSTWLFIKIGLTDLPPLTFAAIRFVFASLILSLLILARGVRWPRGPQRLAADCRRRSTSVHSQLRAGFLGRAAHPFRSRGCVAIDLSGFWPGDRPSLFAARADYSS